MLTSFGAKTLAVLTSGKEGGRVLEEKLQHDGFPTEIVHIRHDIRTNLTISDRQGLSVKLNEQGSPLSDPELTRLRRAVEKHLPTASWLMLCGSLPPGVDHHFYTQLIRLAQKHGVKTLLDADGDALLHGIEAAPTVVRPNQGEAERLLNRALITRAHSIEAARQIQAMGPQYVVLSLGGRGSIGASAAGTFEAVPPRIEAVCPIGARRCTGGRPRVGFRAKGKTFEDALRWGVAAGTASAKLPGINLANFEQASEIYPDVVVTKIG